jgi:cytochrome P450
MSGRALPPGPPGTLVGGHFAEMSRDWLGAYTRYARVFGDVVSYRVGPFRNVLVSDPAMIEQLLVSRSSELRKSPIQQLVRPLIGNGTFLLEGEPWKKRRRMVSPPFHRQTIALYAGTIVRLTSELVAQFKDGQVRDIYRDMTRLALQIVSRTLFDSDVGGVLVEVEPALERAAAALTSRLDAKFPLPNWVPTPAVLRLRAARRDLDGLIDRFVARRRADPRQGRDLISLLLATRDAESGLPLTTEQIRDEAVTIFIAGFETTAISLTWMLWLLAKHPVFMARLKAQVDTVLGGRLPTVDDVGRMSMAENIVLETMRLYPPAWIIGRQAASDLEVGGYRVPKGWGIEFSQWVVHRDPRWWSAPDDFDPDRWMDGLSDRLPRFAYFPFGGGSRVCIGNAFAKMEILLVLATMASEISFEQVGAASVTPEPGFTLRPATPIFLRSRRVDRTNARQSALFAAE